MKYRYKLHPGAYALGENEKFYGDMEAGGWRLVKRGLRYSKFERTEPKQTKYRVEVVKSSLLDDGALTEAQLAVFEDCGWEYAARWGCFHFFRAPKGSDAPEFYQDPRQQAETLKGVQKSLIGSFLLCVLFVALLAPVPVALGGGNDALLASVRRLWLIAPGLPLFWCIMLFSGLAVDLMDIRQIVRTYRLLKKGIPLNHEPKGRGLARIVLDNGLRLIACLCLLSVVLQLVTMRRGDVPPEPDGPYVVLEYTNRPEDTDSEREYTRTVFTEYWNIREHVENLDHAETLYQDVYRLASWLDPMDWVDSLTAKQTFDKKLKDYTPATIEGLDAAWISENGMEAVAVKGQLLAFINYLDGSYSAEHLTEILNALSARWTAFD